MYTMFLWRVGRCGEAEPLYREALAGRRLVLGDAHPGTVSLASVNNLAGLLQVKGDLRGAEPLYREALAGNQHALGDADPDTLTTVEQPRLAAAG